MIESETQQSKDNYFNSIGHSELEVKKAYRIIKRVLNHRANVINHFYGGDSDTMREAQDNIQKRLGKGHKLSNEEVQLLDQREFVILCQIDKDYKLFYDKFVDEMDMALGVEPAKPLKNPLSYDDLPF
jgi:hypothetical protein